MKNLNLYSSPTSLVLDGILIVNPYVFDQSVNPRISSNCPGNFVHFVEVLLQFGVELVLLDNRNMSNAVYRDKVINNVIPIFHVAMRQDFFSLDDNAIPHQSATVVKAFTITLEVLTALSILGINFREHQTHSNHVLKRVSS